MIYLFQALMKIQVQANLNLCSTPILTRMDSPMPKRNCWHWPALINDCCTIPNSISTTGDFQTPPLLEGSMFRNKIREAVFRAKSNLGRSVYAKKQERKIVLYLCKSDGCLFRARFSLLHKSEQWRLSILHDHACLPTSLMVTKSEVVLPILSEALLLDPSMQPSSLQAQAENVLGMPVPRHTITRAKMSILKNSLAHEEDQFRRLPAIVDNLVRVDPTGHFVLEKDLEGRFSKLFVSPSFAVSCL
jgi:hypothetical protein